MATAGYSSTQTAKKLGIKKGYVIRLINEPEYYFQLFTDLPDNIRVAKTKRGSKHIIHFFTKSAGELVKKLPLLRDEIEQNGTIWVSWPKKISKVHTDVTEDTIRNYALEIGLVDVKVCAVDEVWSGLKLVVPMKDRK